MAISIRLKKESQVDPDPVVTYSIGRNPISCMSTFFLSYISACTFFGSLGFAAGGLPPFFLLSSIARAYSSCFFLSYSYHNLVAF